MRVSTRSALASLSLCTTALPFQAFAVFIQDSKATLETRNYYFNRDYRQANAPQSQATEWAQGLVLRYESGFTDGTLGFGLDALGQLGLKLD